MELVVFRLEGESSVGDIIAIGVFSDVYWPLYGAVQMQPIFKKHTNF